MRPLGRASLWLLTSLLVSAVAGGLPVRQAKADEAILTGTLKTVRDRGTLLIGYRENSAPFAFK